MHLQIIPIKSMPNFAKQLKLAMFHELIHLESTESTHMLLQQLADSGEVVCGKMIVADYQTGGKGQGANQWHSKAGLNILMSFCWCPTNFQASRQFGISMAVSLAVVRLLDQCGIADVTIKWPNDIWSGKCKLAGVLVSNTIRGINISHSIISIGLNVNQLSFPQELPNPASMASLTGKAYNRHALIERLRNLLTEMLSKAENEGLDELRTAYLLRMLGIGQKRRFDLGGKIAECRINGVDAYGRILLTLPDGLTKAFELTEARLIQ
jgi:BirA family biotin operon repressor/biotin-[acetyl-CoA-carboxylase] ligase